MFKFNCNYSGYNHIPNFFGTGDEAVIAYGNFIQNVVQFLVIAWVIFLVIKAMNRMNRRRDAKRAAKEAKAKNNN